MAQPNMEGEKEVTATAIEANGGRGKITKTFGEITFNSNFDSGN